MDKAWIDYKTNEVNARKKLEKEVAEIIKKGDVERRNILIKHNFITTP